MNQSRTRVETRMLPLSAIRPDPTQSRSYFDPAAMEDLKVSLRERGLLQPILVRDSGKETHEIIAGERRYRAAAALGWRGIECRVYPTDTPAVETELMSLIENLQRVDLNPIEEAKGYKQLAEPPYSLTNRDVAKRLGKAEDAISRALALLDFPAQIQESLARAKLSPRHARVLAKITNLERQIELANQADREGWTVRRLESEVERASGRAGERQKKAVSSAPPLIRSSALDPLRDLWPSLLSRITLPSPQGWEVSYVGESVWTFKVHADPLTPRATLAGWFEEMATAISGNRRGASLWRPAGLDEEKREAEAFMEKWEPKTLEDMQTLEQESRRMRLPKNDSEQAELEKLAGEGPFAVYAWIFGEGGMTARQVKGKSWKELGAEDPAQAVRSLVAQMRMIQEAGGK